MCAVCRTLQRLLNLNGKIGQHSRTKANPGGCAGAYQAPLKVDAHGEPVTGGATVVGFRAGDDGPTAERHSPGGRA